MHKPERHIQGTLRLVFCSMTKVGNSATAMGITAHVQRRYQCPWEYVPCAAQPGWRIAIAGDISSPSHALNVEECSAKI